MSRNYAYKMDHDKGFAPNTDYDICSLSGCKKKTVEVWARKGSWIIGIGGKNTHQSDKLIYAMEVEENILYLQFKERYPDKSNYLQKEKAGTNVLLSRKFYYFGEHAIDLPEDLEPIIIKGQGCKSISDESVDKLKKYIEESGYKKYGIFGKPNNPERVKYVKLFPAECLLRV